MIPDVNDTIDKILSLGEKSYKYGAKIYKKYNINRAISDFKKVFNLF